MVANGKNSGGNGGGRGSWGFASLIRRKQVDSAHVRREGHTQLARKLSAIDLIAIGAGATIGAGVYILVGTVAREHTGPALTISFLIAGIAAALSAFCYAELACRCPSAGSAYHYAYICVGEGFGWLVGWALILEYTIGGSAVARGITPNLVSVHKTKGVEVQISGGKCITLNLNNSIIVIPDWNFQLSTDTFN